MKIVCNVRSFNNFDNQEKCKKKNNEKPVSNRLFKK